MNKYWLIIISSLLLTACGDDKTATEQKTTELQTGVVRKMDFAQVTRGAKLFQQNCASCHGEKAQGAPNWRQAGADGKFPAPPLNGSGHAWHHPKSVLLDVMTNGTVRIGGNMPAWQDKLSEQDMDDIIAWFQSKWSDDIYKAWYERNKTAGSN